MIQIPQYSRNTYSLGEGRTAEPQKPTPLKPKFQFSHQTDFMNQNSFSSNTIGSTFAPSTSAISPETKKSPPPVD